MNYNDEYKDHCINLGISYTFTNSELKRAYYKLALIHHPDKSKDNGEKFKEINESYNFLCNYKKYNNNLESNNSFSDLIINIINSYDPNIKWSNIFIKTTIENIIKHCESYSETIFKELSKEKSMELYNFFLEYKDIFSISDDLLNRIKKVVQNKFKNDNIILLNPSIEDLLEDKIYKLDINNDIFYVPLWNSHIEYEHLDSTILVKNIPDLSSNIKIDKFNNIYISLVIDIKKLLITGYKEYTLYNNRKIKINAYDLQIKKGIQLVKFLNKGILKVDKNNIFSNEKRGDIIFEINLC